MMEGREEGLPCGSTSRGGVVVVVVGGGGGPGGAEVE